MEFNKVMWKSTHDNWSTPKNVYDELNKEFNFNYDPCPLHSKDNAVFENWGKRCFINPPYSNIQTFLDKAFLEMKKGNTDLCVFLIPSRTDTKWFHKYCVKSKEIRFIKGRLKFGDSKNSAPFPSMLVIFERVLE